MIIVSGKLLPKPGPSQCRLARKEMPILCKSGIVISVSGDSEMLALVMMALSLHLCMFS